jgi:hypothetical protein
MTDPVLCLAPVNDDQQRTDLDRVLAELDAVLAGLESRAAAFGRSAALPFLGLARYELADALTLSRSGPIPPETFEAGETRIDELVTEGLGLEPSLADSLRLLRARGLMREAQAWAGRVASAVERAE